MADTDAPNCGNKGRPATNHFIDWYKCTSIKLPHAMARTTSSVWRLLRRVTGLVDRWFVEVAPSLIALNTTDEALLRFVPANGGISTVSEAYGGINVFYAIGDAAKTNLLQLGFMTATLIVARSGRGGAANALQLTPAGYERLGMTPPRRSRGAQSEYLIQSLHKLLPGSNIEVTLG